MTHFRAHTAPASLYVRGIELGLLPLDRALTCHSSPGPLMYTHALALLAAAELTAEQRALLEDSRLAYARYASTHPLQGAEAYAHIVPLLSPGRQAAARSEAGPVLAQAGTFLWRTRPEGGSWMALYRDQCTPLPYRKLWQVLAPEQYPAWLRQHCDRMLRPLFWWTPPVLYRENLAQLHLLGGDMPRGLALALEGLTNVCDGFVTADREFGMGGAYAFSEDDVAEADREAARVALSAIAPILPPELHQRTVAIAAELGSAPPTDLGAQLADPLAASGLAWYCAMPEQPVPWLTVAERAQALAGVGAATRSAHVAALVEAAFPLADAFRLDSTKGHPNKPLTEQWARFAHEDLPVAAPYLDQAQTRALLALWGL
jgi:hypothetical protein